MTIPNDNRSAGPAELVAVARAAHLTEDRDLERAAKRELLDRFGIAITFRRRTAPRPADGRGAR